MNNISKGKTSKVFLSKKVIIIKGPTIYGPGDLYFVKSGSFVIKPTKERNT